MCPGVDDHPTEHSRHFSSLSVLYSLRVNVCLCCVQRQSQLSKRIHMVQHVALWMVMCVALVTVCSVAVAFILLLCRERRLRIREAVAASVRVVPRNMAEDVEANRDTSTEAANASENRTRQMSVRTREIMMMPLAIDRADTRVRTVHLNPCKTRHSTHSCTRHTPPNTTHGIAHAHARAVA